MTLVAVLALASCASQPYFVARDEPWRKDVEIACLRSGAVAASAFVAGRSALGGPSVCGAIQPFEVSAAASGLVSLKPPAIVQCGMIPAIDRWVERVVVPAAYTYLGVGVAQLKVAASYSCRPMNNVPGAKLSEHGHANAVDISAFVLADGQTITVKAGWHGGARERAFLRAVHDGGCRIFSTVLGPEANSYHRDHFHFDLARHGRLGDGRVCE